MSITIIICTFNRASVLRDTLASFAQLDRPADQEVRLIVVDNNSSDDTPAVVEEAQRSDATISYAREPTPGLSVARNTGIRLCATDLLAFVDDDIYFDGRWLVELCRAFHEHPEAVCVGGKSIPLFEGGTPAWMSERLLKLYGSTNSGETPRPMRYPEHPFGLNMGFRKAVFDSIGGFDPRLGRIKNSLLSNEETELFYRIHQAGMRVHYTPMAIVRHRIAAARTDEKWVIRRYYWQGISDVAFEQAISRTRPIDLLRDAKRAFQRLAIVIWNRSFGLPRGGDDAQSAVLNSAKFWYEIGFIKQCVIEAWARVKVRTPDHA